MRIDEIGEFGLIEKIAHLVGSPSSGVILSIGDDTAVVRTNSNLYSLLTTENFLEGIHFKLDYVTPYQLGYKALAVNLSDIAAMAGVPRFALVSLALRPQAEVSFVEEIYKGMQKLAQKFGVDIIGGDTSSSPQIAVNITVFGEVEPELLRTRAAAKIDDKILVTGHLGASAAGLALFLQFNGKKISEFDEELKDAHLLPQPRINEARLAAKMEAHAIEDISDGLAMEIRHICKSSKVGAHLSSANLPVARGVPDIARRLDKDPLELALSGGEDYELVFTAPKKAADRIISAIEAETGTRVTAIGEIISSPEIMLEDKEGGTQTLSAKGYQHFTVL